MNKWSDMHQKKKSADKAWMEYLDARTAFDIAEKAYFNAHMRLEKAEREWRLKKEASIEAELLFNEE